MPQIIRMTGKAVTNRLAKEEQARLAALPKGKVKIIKKEQPNHAKT